MTGQGSERTLTPWPVASQLPLLSPLLPYPLRSIAKPFFGLAWALCPSLVLFLIHIDQPATHSFDEFHYVPSAKQFLDLQANQNWEHPPLGKMLMAVGIAIFGDEPLGWRFMSACFGSLTLVGMYLWALALFASQEAGLWVAAVTLGNQLLYVQARIGMLDTFMMGFLVFALASFTASWDAGLEPARGRRYLRFSGAMFGLAVACKWFAVMPLAGCIGAVFLVKLLQFWQTRMGDGEPARGIEQPWYSLGLWQGLSLWDWVLALGVIPFACYYVCFLPTIFIEKPAGGLLAFFGMQARMYDGQLRVVSPHPYGSDWKQWPLMQRPIWYAFDHELDPAYVRGVLLLGNPLVMWFGLVGLVCCAWDFVVRRSRDAAIILLSYGVLYGSWIVIPRKLSFYYYYYPAGLTLGLALAVIFCRGGERSLIREPGRPVLRWIFLGAVYALFFYFLPILSGERIVADTFRKWMWFPSWI